MGQVHKLSHDYFDVNLERSDIWAKLFCEKDQNIGRIELLYDFCAHDEAFTDIADFIHSSGRCMRNGENLGHSVVVFIEHIKKSNLFTSEEISHIREKLQALVMLWDNRIVQTQDEIIYEVNHTLGYDKKMLH